MDPLPGRTVIVSPHLDDGILSCGALMSRIPDSVVLTVFAGSPPSWQEHRLWDHDFCGFPEGADVIAARVEEDEEALGRLGATGKRLSFLDEQYREPAPSPSAELIGAAVAAAIREVVATRVVMPLGLGHEDHRLCTKACLVASEALPLVEWFVYMDLPYGHEPDLFGDDAVDQAVTSIRPVTLVSVPLDDGGGVGEKERALDCYRSQLRGLGQRRESALRPERYWRIQRP